MTFKNFSVEMQQAALFQSNAADREDLKFRMMGILPLIFFGAQAIHYWRISQLGHMLWMCNIGNLVLGVGLLLGYPILVRVSVMWMLPGILVWFIYVVMAWGVFFSSTLAHVGGLIVGLIAIRRTRMNQVAWLYGFLWYLIVQAFSRLFTPAQLNVNVSHRIQESWQGSFTAYWKFWLVLSSGVAVGLWVLAFVLSRIWPATNKEPIEI